MKENLQENENKENIIRIEEKTNFLEKQLDNLGKEEKKFQLLLAVLGGIIMLLLSYFLVDFNSTLREFEHRISVLETKIDDCCKSKEVVSNFGGYNWSTYIGDDFNDRGEKILSLEIGILSEDYRWNCGSYSEIVKDKKVVDFSDIIKKYSNNRHLKGVKEILCVGMASEEGYLENEEGRAANRMETLINLVEDNIQNDTIKITGINIGKYNSETTKDCDNTTLDQRRVVLLKVLEKNSDLSEEDFKRSIQRILVDKANNIKRFPLDIRQYSKYPHIELREGRE